MLQKVFIRLAWLYWKVNKPFVAVFAESILGYGEGGLEVDGKAVVKSVDRFLHEVNASVFLQFIGTLALLPLYVPPSLPKSNLKRALITFEYGLRSFVSHGHFMLCGKPRRAEWIDTMYRRLIKEAPEHDNDKIKVIVTLSMFRQILAMAYLDQEKLWPAIDYQPFTERAWSPPSGANLAQPPRTAGAELLHANRKTARDVAIKPPGRLTYCVIGSGAGGAVAAKTILDKDPKARVVLLEAGALITHDQFRPTSLGSLSKLYMNGGLTLSRDQQFMFAQGRCVGGSTTVNNSVAFTPEGFWWNDLKTRWRDLGANLDFERLHRQYDILQGLLHVEPVDARVITKGATTIRDGWMKILQSGNYTSFGLTSELSQPITVPSNTMQCIGCGRCNLGCQYDAKRAGLSVLLPDFVAAGGLLVPDAGVTRIEFEPTGNQPGSRVAAVHVRNGQGSTRIEADRFILAGGAYASTKLLWRSGFLGAVPGVRTVGKHFSVNAGSPVIGIFPERQDAFLGQQVGFALEIPEERMIIETAFAPPALAAMGMPAWGKEFQRRLKKVNHMMTGTPVFATTAYGQVRKGKFGESGFVIDFSLADDDWRRLEKGMNITAEAMFAMGAEEVYIGRFDARSVKRGEDVAKYFGGIGPDQFINVLSAHMQGGNIIGAEPYHGVVDQNLKVFGLDNLWICDASVIPAPITVNIAMTVMALSRYAIEQMFENS